VWCATPSAAIETRFVFSEPYLQHRVPFPFRHADGSLSPVRAFGLRPQDDSRFASLREQAQLLWDSGSRSEGTFEFAVDLCSNCAERQLVVAVISRPPSLAAAIERFAMTTPRALDGHAVLLVPELAGYVDGIELRIGRGGDRISGSAANRVGRPVRHLVVDRPFLFIKRRRDNGMPTFAMWIENAALLRSFDESELPREPPPPDRHRMVEVQEDIAIKRLEGRTFHFTRDWGAEWREHLTREELIHSDLYIECPRASEELLQDIPCERVQLDHGTLLRVVRSGEAWEQTLRRNELTLRGPSPDVRLLAIRREPRPPLQLVCTYAQHPTERRDDGMHLASFRQDGCTRDEITSCDLREDTFFVCVTGAVSQHTQKALAVASWRTIRNVLAGYASGVSSVLVPALPGFGFDGAILRLDKRSPDWSDIVTSGTLAMYLRTSTARDASLALVAQKISWDGF